MEKLTLDAQTRTEMKKKKVWALREEGVIPAVVYGGKENINIKVKKNEFTKLYAKTGESTIITLVLDGKKEIPVLVKEEQVDPILNDYTHVDFKEIDMAKEIVVPVELNFLGEAPAIKELGGTFVRNLNHVQVRCLPSKLVHFIDVDLSALKTFDDAIHVSDLKIPEGIKVTNLATQLVAKVVEQKVEIEPVATEAAAAPTPELIGEKKEEGAAVDTKAPAGKAPAAAAKASAAKK